jgi:Restriction endonuclease
MRIRQHQSPDATVLSPDFIADVDTGEQREVDIGIHVPTNQGETFIAIECRDRRAQQSVEWIEQLISKKNSVGANVLIAITASNFSRPARIKALRHGILLAKMSSKLPSELATLPTSLWLTVRNLSPVVQSLQIEAGSPVHDDSLFRHKLASDVLTLPELVQVWMNPNLIRSLPKYIDDFAKAKFVKFQLVDIDAWIVVGDEEFPITKAELILELNYGEEELTLRSMQELMALDSQAFGEATAYDFGSDSHQLSEVIQDHGSEEFRWDILAKPLLEEGKVLIGAGLRSSKPISITTMRLDL